MKKVSIILIIPVVVLSVMFIKNMNSNDISKVNDSGYQGEIGEVINFRDYPIINIGSITIQYLGFTPPPRTTKGHSVLSGTDKFNVSVKTGKSFQVNWSSGTGELPWPSYFITKDGCYELHVNVIIEDHLKNIQDKLLLRYASSDKCGDEVIDLR